MTPWLPASLPAWAAWIAQDADGTWWAYEHAPNEADQGWYENEVGRSLRLGRTAPDPHWRASLRRVRGRLRERGEFRPDAGSRRWRCRRR